MTAAAWWLMALFVIPGQFGPGGQHAQLGRYAALGESWPEILRTLLTRPGVVWGVLSEGSRLSYLANLLAPLAFTPLVGLPVLLIGLPTLAMNALSNYEPMHTFGKFHYGAPIAPIVVAAGALGTSYLVGLAERKGPRAATWATVALCRLVLVASVLFQLLYGYAPLAEGFEPPTVTAHDRLASRFEGQIPPEAAVSAQSRLLPHLSQRERIYMFPRMDDADYAFVDVSEESWPVHPNDVKRQIDEMLEGEYSIADAADGYALLRRGDGLERWPDEFYDFARTAEAKPEHAMILDFGDELRFLGLDVVRGGGMTKLRMYWTALEAPTRDLRIHPFFFDDATGEVIEDTSARPLVATLWYPTSMWKPDEIVVVETLPWDVGDDFGVGLGVLDGGTWGERERRLPVEVASSELLVRTFDDATWAKLLEYRDGEPRLERREFDAPAVSHPAEVALEGGPELLGADLEATDVKPGGKIDAILYWRAVQPMERSYTAFVHLLDDRGALVAQSDSIPVGGGYPTFWWAEGEVVRDPHALELPETLPAGRYRLIAGMYDEEGARLPAGGEAGAFPDGAVPLAEIEASP